MEKGFFQLIVILLLFIVILSLLGVSLSGLAGNQVLKDNFSFIWKWTVIIWDKVLKGPLTFAWRIWVDFLWNPFVETMQKIKR